MLNNNYSTEPTGEQPSPSRVLRSKNIRIHKRRTSIRLEPQMWSALNEIAALESCSIHDLCGAVHDLKAPEISFTAAMRVFMMEYYRSASRASSHVALVQKQVKARQSEKTKEYGPSPEISGAGAF